MKIQFFSNQIQHQTRVWGIPAVYITTALVLGGIIPYIDLFIFSDISLFHADLAVTLLSTISGGMITFTGIVFSMIFVMIQFSSNAYSPRLAPFYLQDGVIKHSLGMFTATFLFSLTSLAATNLYKNGDVPDLSVLISIAAVVISAVLFLALIQRISVLQITSVLFMIARFGRREILENYPEQYIETKVNGETRKESLVSSQERSIFYSGISASVLEVDTRQLITLASKNNIIIEILYATGDTVPEGAAIARLYGDSKKVSDWQILRTIHLGEQRTIDQDPRYALRLIVDIAIRALSPAINDPTTAVMALDRLEDLLRLFVTRELDTEYRHDAKGDLRLIYPSPDWEDILALAVDEIRFYGAKSIQVSRRLLALLSDLESIAPKPRQPSIKEHIHRVEMSIKRAFPDRIDRLDASQLDRQGIGLTRASEKE